MTNPKDLVGAKKAPMDLVPAAGAIMSAPAHYNGMEKYGAFNWRLNPVQLMTYLAAIRRHLDAFVDGQDLAEDTGIHHLSHMMAGMNIIADAMGLGNLIDNRPPKGPAAKMLAEQDRSTKPLPVVSTENDPPRFLCGHAFGEEPSPDCGTAVHWSRVNGIELKPGPDVEARECGCLGSEHDIGCNQWPFGRDA